MVSTEKQDLRAYLRGRIEEGGTLIIGYLPGLYPDEESFNREVELLLERDICALEVGIPGRTPPLEGDTISSALKTVSEAVPDPLRVMRLSVALTKCQGAYPIAMAFARTVEEIGLERFVREAGATGASALLVPDLPESRRRRLHELATEEGMQTVLFQGAEEPRKRVYGSEAFMYVQTADMPTGGRFEATEELGERIAELREGSGVGKEALPLALGFGIREHGDVEAAQRLGADIAIVGTALVEAASRGLGEFRRYLKELAG
ncbi:MAG: tryptophan synthase subunit alpha [Spirochaetaceae bacterium]